MNRSNTVLIITEKKKEIRKGILNKIDRAKLTAYGGFTESERPVLMCGRSNRIHKVETTSGSP
ncbi:hypothetical protein ABEP00_10695 [Heyndrickxia sporothermodurans]|uniref:Uncharacterized protein n=1 Tax=Heyndrickxia sporothermodurans TaxID=46224 RepID=A0A150LB58_9BACI|nr:hypothetical protein B4102_1912 [Heyndrickxia sporothermodurans]